MTAAIIDHHTGTRNDFHRYRRVAVPSVVRPPQPNYRARRVGAALCVVAVGFIGVAASSALLASFGGEPAAAAEASSAPLASAPSRHVARPGDTLWSIAHRYRGDVDHARYVDALVPLNGAASIEVGQAVLLP